MSVPRLLRTQAGKQISLGRELGRGGEGTIYEVQGIPSVAAKIYHTGKAAERQQKIAAMVTAGWHKSVLTAAFPIDALFAGDHFLGFTMPLISGQREIHDLYSPTSRRTAFPSANFRFLVRTSLNIARAIANVHATGCVIGDLNQSGILIGPNAIATLIDCDSFQVAIGGHTYICKVGKEEFTPPELQGKRLDQVLRSANNDVFGLAVIIFQLLFMGRHPFAGRFLGRGDMPMQIAIAQYRFAYSSRKGETQMEPPPHVPILSDIPKEIADAFEVAFGQVGSSRGRPTATDWVTMLGRAEQQITSCRHNLAHHFFRPAASCPWCRMESAYPGFLAFTPNLIQVSPTPINLGQLIAAVRGVPDPGTAPELTTLMPAFSGTAAPIAANMRRLSAIYVTGLLGVLAGVLTLRFQILPAPFEFFLLGAAVFLTIRQPKELETVEKALAQSKSAWGNMEAQWRQVKDNKSFLVERRVAEETIRQLQALPGEEAKRLAALKAHQREAQLNAFLERFYIDHSATKIKGVGNSRKVVLRSYGIETAADVAQHRIQQISGFGPKITGELIAWRKSLERRFVFDPSEPIKAADIAAVRAQIYTQQLQLEKQLRDAHAGLQKCSQQIQSLRAHLRNAAVAVWNAKGQSAIDAAGYLKLFSRRNRIIAVVAALLLGLIAPIQRNVFTSAESANPPLVPHSHTSEGESTGSLSKSRTSDQLLASQAASSATSLPLNIRPANRPADRGGPLSQPEPQRESVPGARSPYFQPVVRGAERVVQPEAEPPPPGSPLNVGSAEREVAKALRPVPVLRPLDPKEIHAIQARLDALGYTSPTTGAWDKATRTALRDFKVANRLGASDAWDLAAQQRLDSHEPVPVEESFIGNWSTSECSSVHNQDVPLAINSYRAKSNAGGRCEFITISNVASGWRVHALCSVGNRRWTSDITFTLQGSQLIWSSAYGTTRYFRCR